MKIQYEEKALLTMLLTELKTKIVKEPRMNEFNVFELSLCLDCADVQMIDDILAKLRKE